MKLLIITDSLGYPRITPEIVNYDETWCHLLSKQYDAYQFSFGGATVLLLLKQAKGYLQLYRPDIVIVQAGIVDCAPRALTKKENYLINKYWITRKLMRICAGKIIPVLRKRNIAYTSLSQFEKSVLEFKKLFHNKLFWVGILPAGIDYEQKNPGIKNRICVYNQIVRDYIENRFIDMSEIDQKYFFRFNVFLLNILYN
ncbi:MAG: hypothetical protein D3913_05805 [Candidatus Electrothrix sp. LOE1_4_5]|nr:hypothetical protein [Candidatus Electrothrix gigas]